MFEFEKSDLVHGGLLGLSVAMVFAVVSCLFWVSSSSLAMLAVVAALTFSTIAALAFYRALSLTEKDIQNAATNRIAEQMPLAVFLLDIGAEVMGYLKFHVEAALKKPAEGDNARRFWKAVVVMAALINETTKLEGGSQRVEALKQWFLNLLTNAALNSSDAGTAAEMVKKAIDCLGGVPILRDKVYSPFLIAALGTRLSDYVIDFDGSPNQ